MTEQLDLAERKSVARIVRIALVLLAISLVWMWIGGKMRPVRNRVTIPPTVSAGAPPVLGPGDLQILSRNGSVELVLRGNQILAGLSPSKVAEVKAKMQESSSGDTTGLGGIIASSIKGAVGGLVGTHMVYDVADIRDITYDNGRLVIYAKSGERTRLFGDNDSRGDRELFEPADAERFIAAVHARMAAPLPSSAKVTRAR